MHTVIYVAAINKHRSAWPQNTSTSETFETVPAHYEVGFWQQVDGNADNYLTYFHVVKSFVDENTALLFCRYLNGGSLEWWPDSLTEVKNV